MMRFSSVTTSMILQYQLNPVVRITVPQLEGALRSRKVVSAGQLRTGSGREQYFVIKPGDSSTLKPGIFRRYRLKGTLSQAFVFAKQQSTPSIDYHGVIRKAAEERLPGLIQTKLSRLLR